MKIAVLDYSKGSVDIFEINDCVDIVWYLTEVMGYDFEEIHWMEVKCINIHI